MSCSAIGDTINLAARLQAVARPGELVIGPTTLERLHDRASVVPLGATELKGRREPVPVYRLVSVTAEGGAMRERSGPFWDAMRGRAPLPHAAATLGMEFIDADVEAGTIELGFTATEDFTNPSGNVLGAFVAAMLYDTVGAAPLATLAADQFQSTPAAERELPAAGPARPAHRQGPGRPPRRGPGVPGGLAGRPRRGGGGHRHRHRTGDRAARRGDRGMTRVGRIGGAAPADDGAAVMQPPALELVGLVKRFGEKTAVDRLDLAVPPGSFFGLVGPNGAGKTTALSMAVGLLRPDAGTARVFGVEVGADPVAAKRLIGVLPDNLALPHPGCRNIPPSSHLRAMPHPTPAPYPTDRRHQTQPAVAAGPISACR
jgi:hypothetical protein